MPMNASTLAGAIKTAFKKAAEEDRGKSEEKAKKDVEEKGEKREEEEEKKEPADDPITNDVYIQKMADAIIAEVKKMDITAIYVLTAPSGPVQGTIDIKITG